MARHSFRGHRFSQDVILCAVRWYCRYGLSYRDVRDLLAERRIIVDASTVYRWVRKFGPEIAKRSQKHRSWRGLGWHVDETYLRVGGRWCYVWRAVDQQGQLIDFRVTARRNTAAAKAFIRQALNKSRLYQPLSIVTDKAPTYARVMKDMNARMLPDEAIRSCQRKVSLNRATLPWFHDQEPVSLFQNVARAHPACGDDVCSVSTFIAQCRGPSA